MATIYLNLQFFGFFRSVSSSSLPDLEPAPERALTNNFRTPQEPDEDHSRPHKRSKFRAETEDGGIEGNREAPKRSAVHVVDWNLKAEGLNVAKRFISSEGTPSCA